MPGQTPTRDLPWAHVEIPVGISNTPAPNIVGVRSVCIYDPDQNPTVERYLKLSKVARRFYEFGQDVEKLLNLGDVGP